MEIFSCIGAAFWSWGEAQTMCNSLYDTLWDLSTRQATLGPNHSPTDPKSKFREAVWYFTKGILRKVSAVSFMVNCSNKEMNESKIIHLIQIRTHYTMGKRIQVFVCFNPWNYAGMILSRKVELQLLWPGHSSGPRHPHSYSYSRTPTENPVSTPAHRLISKLANQSYLFQLIASLFEDLLGLFFHSDRTGPSV